MYIGAASPSLSPAASASVAPSRAYAAAVSGSSVHSSARSIDADNSTILQSLSGIESQLAALDSRLRLLEQRVATSSCCPASSPLSSSSSSSASAFSSSTAVSEPMLSALMDKLNMLTERVDSMATKFVLNAHCDSEDIILANAASAPLPIKTRLRSTSNDVSYAGLKPGFLSAESATAKRRKPS